MLGSWTWFFLFHEPWKREPGHKKAADFERNVRFLLLCILKRSLSVVFAIMCRHILLRNRGIWLYVAKVVKYYGRHNACTGIFYFDVWFWRLVSHIESFEFQYRLCSVILSYDAKFVFFIMQVLHRTCSFYFTAVFWRQRIGGLTPKSSFPYQEDTYFFVDGGTQHTLRRFLDNPSVSLSGSWARILAEWQNSRRTLARIGWKLNPNGRQWRNVLK